LSHFRDVFFPKRRSLLSTTLRRLVSVKLDMHLIPHDSLVETEMSEYSEGTDSWVQTIVEATEQHDLENDLQSVARHAKEDDVAGVNQNVGDLDEEQVGEDSLEGDEEDDEGCSACILEAFVVYNGFRTTQHRFNSASSAFSNLPGKMHFGAHKVKLNGKRKC
jgi:hypothetical protein